MLNCNDLAPVKNFVADLTNVSGGFYTDRDCAPTGTQAFYFIQGGNTDSAFQISLGIISVGRFISYRQETKFELNVSVTTYSVNSVDSPGRQGSTIVVVNILDIDDSDPVFDNLEYTLHVQEENSTAINVTHLTIPPVFAFDQDTGINDNITYSINGPSDVVDIHNETGQVWVTCVLDREVNPYVKVGIKANQVHNSWRSAVATLLVVVDDINDNRPKFQPDNPTLVRIPEHSAFGSSVVRVLALDEDVGENALFNYTVDAPEGTFYIETDNLDKPRYGTVIVTNSSALDRETISSLTITVGTVEYTPAQGGDCSTGMCNITITIQLTDINDNSPVFQNVTYSLTVTNNNRNAFVGMINASDADEGENADLRYRCVSSSLLGADACAVMSVDDKTGEITLNEPLEKLQKYYALLEACDSPEDFSQRRCTTVPVTVALDLEVHVTSYNFTVHENLPAGTYVGDILIYNSLFTLQHDEFELDEK
ncbi:protocadherin-3-like [Pomacea canaliculata]|uniref:protocadherin-3-like n=1 Tax=Pomacea canaliculata TaxID=400727 RepID=UPI000D728EA0|nr:protocadherin-3-like [Pomacea canaliculata]